MEEVSVKQLRAIINQPLEGFKQSTVFRPKTTGFLLAVARILGITLYSQDTMATALNLAKIQGYQKAYYDTLNEFTKLGDIVKVIKSTKKKGKK